MRSSARSVTEAQKKGRDLRIYQAFCKAGKVANVSVDVLRSKGNTIILSRVMPGNNNFHGDRLSHHLQRFFEAGGEGEVIV